MAKKKQNENFVRQRRFEERINLAEANVSRRSKVQKMGTKLPKIKKQRKHRRAWHRFCWGTLIILGTVLIIYAFSPYSTVTKVNFHNNSALSDRQVIDLTGIQKGKKIWQVWGHDKKMSAKASAREPQIKAVSVSWTNPQAISVSVTENNIVGYGKTRQGYDVIFADGQIKKLNRTTPDDSKPIMYGFSRENAKRFAEQFVKLPNAVQTNVSEVHWVPSKANSERLRLFMNDGNEVIGKLSTIGDKLKYYPQMVDQMHGNGIINLEVGAYSRPYHQ